jgi:hypothetical protein
LHCHFHGHRALLETVFNDRVEQMCAEADRIAEQWPASEALWVWLRHVAQHCAAEKARRPCCATLTTIPRHRTAPLTCLPAPGQKLLDGAAAAGALQPGATLKELLLLVNAVADVYSDNDADIDRILDLAWNGARRAPTGTS